MIYKTKLEELKEKRIEIENNYNKAKEHRIKIVESMNELDKQIEEIDEIIKKSEERFIDRHFNHLKHKQLIKSYFKFTMSQWGIAIIITALLKKLLVGEFAISIGGIITSGIAIGLINFVQYTLKYSKKEKKTKKATKTIKNIEMLKQEREKLIEKRIIKGAEYKRSREEEVLREKIYKELEPILTVEIVKIMEGEEVPTHKTTISTKDIYHKIKLDYSFDKESLDNKKKILDNELKKYISLKISELYLGTINPQDLEFLSTEELVKMLISEIPKEFHNDVLSNIIHAILNFSSNLQKYGVVWYEEKNAFYINNPTATFDEEGIWTEYRTHKDTNYYHVFETAYNTFITDVMRQQKVKTKTKSNYDL